MGVELTAVKADYIKILPKNICEQYFGGDPYLKKITFNKKSYIGKIIPELPKLEDLKNIQQNIISLISLIFLKYPVGADQIVIFPYEEFNS